jgi:aminoglycoside phosphotransferase (APT) family kinase protein
MVAKIYLDHTSAERCRREALAMTGLHREGVAVPEVIAYGDVGAGGPTLVMRRVPGARSIGDVFADSPEEDRLHHVRSFCRLLQRVHSFDWRPLDGELLHFPADEPRGFLTHRIDHFRQLTERFGEQDFAEPIDWLAEHAASVDDQRLVLGHGDFHQSNVLVEEGGGLAIIDWGGAEVVDYRADLGWTLLLSGTRAPGLREAILEEYGRAMGEPVRGIEYFEALAAVRRLLNLSISLHHGAESLGMRPGAELLMRRDGDHFRQVLAILEQRTGLELPRLAELTARLG